MSKYGMPTSKAASTYEAWLRRQPTRDLREMLADPEIDKASVKFINRLIKSR